MEHAILNTAQRSGAHREVCLISIQLWGCNYHTSFALGTVQVQESGGREASSDQSNTDAPYLTHQHCGHEGYKLYNNSPMPTAPRGKWMDACRGRVCPSPVSLQTSTSCCLGTDQMWLQDVFQGSLLMQEEQPPLHCSLQMPKF